MITFLIILGLYIIHILISRQLWIWMRLITEDDCSKNEAGIICAFMPGGVFILTLIFISIIIPDIKINNFFTPKKYRK